MDSLCVVDVVLVRCRLSRGLQDEQTPVVESKNRHEYKTKGLPIDRLRSFFSTFIIFGLVKCIKTEEERAVKSANQITVRGLLQNVVDDRASEVSTRL